MSNTTIPAMVFTLSLLALVSPASLGDVPSTQAGEVLHLIEYLENSGCEMIRNGKSHDGKEAAKHVRRKYDHFRSRISSTEEFIEYSASKSTISGKEYEVHCPGLEAVSSSEWLLEELDSYRRSHPSSDS